MEAAIIAQSLASGVWAVGIKGGGVGCGYQGSRRDQKIKRS